MVCVFFFKQKTAYEMRISDWSSDVCSSELRADALGMLQVLVRPGRGNQLDADRRAVRNPEGDEQKGLRRGEVCQVGEVLAGFPADRSEERRVGKECVSPGRSRCSPNN